MSIPEIPKPGSFVPPTSPIEKTTSSSKKSSKHLPIPTKTGESSPFSLPKDIKTLTADPEKIISLLEDSLHKIDKNALVFNSLAGHIEELNHALEKQDLQRINELSQALIDTISPYSESADWLDWLQNKLFPIISGFTDAVSSLPSVDTFSEVLTYLESACDAKILSDCIFLFLKRRVIMRAKEQFAKTTDPVIHESLKKWIETESHKLSKEWHDYLIQTAPNIGEYLKSGTASLFDIIGKSSPFIVEHGSKFLYAIGIALDIVKIVASGFTLKRVLKKETKHKIALEKAAALEKKPLKHFVQTDYKSPSNRLTTEELREKVSTARRATLSLLIQKHRVQTFLAKARSIRAKTDLATSIVSAIVSIVVGALTIAGVITIGASVSTGIGIGFLLLGLLFSGIGLYIYYRKKPTVFKTLFRVKIPLMINSIGLSINKARAATAKLEMLSVALKISIEQETNKSSTSESAKLHEKLDMAAKNLEAYNQKISNWEKKIAPLKKKLHQAKWKDLLSNMQMNETWYRYTNIKMPKIDSALLDKLRIKKLSFNERIQLRHFDKMVKTGDIFLVNDKIALHRLLLKYDLLTTEERENFEKNEAKLKDPFDKIVDSLFIHPRPQIGKEMTDLFNFLGIDLHHFKNALKTQEGMKAAKQQIKAMLI